MKKKFILYIIVFLLPLMVFANVWQSFRYNALKNEIAGLENAQKEWLEKNRKIINGIAFLSSPQRIEKIAEEELGLEHVDGKKIIRIRFSKDK